MIPLPVGGGVPTFGGLLPCDDIFMDEDKFACEGLVLVDCSPEKEGTVTCEDQGEREKGGEAGGYVTPKGGAHLLYYPLLNFLQF